jgi:chemotaxis family two-component system sensor kinase Cph1
VIADIEKTLGEKLWEQNATISVPKALPTVQCDTVRITELFRNLIVNALKYNESQAKRVEIGCSNPNNPVLYVKDNGIGIDAEFHTEIFRIFKRLHSDKQYAGGTGAGLTFVKKIVEQHHGKIWLSSSKGEGTTFFFTLKGA